MSRFRWTIALVIAVGIISIPQKASAQFYVQATASVNTPAIGSSFEEEVETGMGVGSRIGYQFPNDLRLFAEIMDYRFPDKRTDGRYKGLLLGVGASTPIWIFNGYAGGGFYRIENTKLGGERSDWVLGGHFGLDYQVTSIDLGNNRHMDLHFGGRLHIVDFTFSVNPDMQATWIEFWFGGVIPII
ncbi:hypothetical protein ACFL6R_05020 [Gemmatimonadota bacterium]